ncbi:MAG: PQQ-binding-like beta-propeller repeat protein [Planctomycetota bacterium]
MDLSTTLLVPFSLVGALALEPSSPTPASDWSTWRGPTADGVAGPDARPPLTWSEDDNVRWKVEIDGLGNSTPLVLGERIYLTTAIDLGEGKSELGEVDVLGPQPGPPGLANHHAFVVLALDTKTGDEDWRRVVVTEVPRLKQHKTGSHASPSIVTDGTTLVANFGTSGLYGMTLDGEVKWTRRLGDKTVAADFGEGSTAAVHGKTMILQWDQEGPSFVAAFAIDTGEELWRKERKFDSSWGSPAIATVDGRAQVILNGTDITVGHDVETGEEIWRCGGMSKNPTTSPLVRDGVLFVMNSYRGDVTQAIRLEGAKGELDGTDAVLWTRQRGASYVPTPVAHDGLLYNLRDSNGLLNCLDAATGEPVYTAQRLGDLRDIHASPIVADGRIYISSREGRTVVVREGSEFEILAENALDDVFDATPVFVGDAILLRGRAHLYCIGEK